MSDIIKNIPHVVGMDLMSVSIRTIISTRLKEVEDNVRKFTETVGNLETVTKGRCKVLLYAEDLLNRSIKFEADEVILVNLATKLKLDEEDIHITKVIWISI